MRVLIIADPHIPVPPPGYGGTERIVALQAQTLVAAGHEVRLLAGPGSCDYGGGLIVHRRPALARFSRAFRKIWFQWLLLRSLRGVDAVINHGRIDYLSAVLAGKRPLVSWFHNPVRQGEIDYLNQFRVNRRCLVFVSASQRSALDELGEERVVPNAVDLALYTLGAAPARPRYVAFLGRLTGNKGVHLAIRAARIAGIHLKIAGNISNEPGGREYFETMIRPELGRGCEWVGEVNDRQKQTLLQGASALLFPIQWEEPFGLVLIESLACGTPVVAFRRAATAEIVGDGVTGFLCEDTAGMAEALGRIDRLDRGRCRAEVERRFGPRNLLDGTLAALAQAAWPRPCRSRGKILVVADARLTVPPRHYGGTERMAANFCRRLQEDGYEVRLLAKAGSRTFGGRLIPHIMPTQDIFSRAWRKFYFQWLLDRAAADCAAMVNFGRVDYLRSVLHRSVPLVCRFGNPVRQQEIDFVNRYRREHRAFVFISHSQAAGLRDADPRRIVYNGIDTDFFQPGTLPPSQRTYLAFVGRLTESKGIGLAIAAARESGLPLKIAGNISDEPAEARFFEEKVRPRLGPGCQWVGMVDDEAKRTILQGARALLFPIQWPEPFGIVMAESLACGTPVVALRHGSAPEVIREGVTGFVCDHPSCLAPAIRAAAGLSAQACRADAEARFSLRPFHEGMMEAVALATMRGAVDGKDTP
jgi:glycosyltransferase involved in cell wall biosynthesis